MIRCRAVIPKARVLPVPVRAWPIMSVPVSAIGMDICWIGNGWTMFTSARASTMSGSTPMLAKVASSAGVVSTGAAVVVSVVRISYFRVRQSRGTQRCATCESIAPCPLGCPHDFREALIMTSEEGSMTSDRGLASVDDGYRAGAVDLLGILAY